MEFQGYSADRTFIRGLQEKLGDWPGDVLSRLSRINPLQTPLAGLSQVHSQQCDDVQLPARGKAVALVRAALDAQILFCVVHRPTFESSFNLVYSLEPSEYSSKEKRFTSLLYATMAYGSLFVETEAQETGYDEVILKAYRSPFPFPLRIKPESYRLLDPDTISRASSFRMSPAVGTWYPCRPSSL